MSGVDTSRCRCPRNGSLGGPWVVISSYPLLAATPLHSSDQPERLSPLDDKAQQIHIDHLLIHAQRNPLNCAARNPPNTITLKTLLNFGADTEASGVVGKTSLIHVTRTDNVPLALLLLEYSTNINVADVTGQTPLTTAITYNSYRVLQLLLDRWYEYSVCPRLQGAHLVEAAAKYADVETLKILNATNHFRFKYDKENCLVDFVEQLRARFDADNELVAAFQDQLSIIKQNPEMKERAERLLESGLLPFRDAEKDMDSDLESEGTFLDAVASQVEEEKEKIVDLLA
jgi:ankyrin repeat protein